jgi:NAD(P)-dependent dehydrogenase (short-subunit alcohol dehydrogenase family)
MAPVAKHPMPLQSNTVVVTGCSTGFGRAAALHLARRGWRVFAAVRREADGESLLAEAEKQDARDRISIVLCDITRADDVARLAATVRAAAPALRGLVNNAGTAFPGPLEILPLDDLRAQLELNVIAQLAVTQALLPLLKAGRGVIVNVSSIGGRVAFPITGAYCMSKFALEAMSDALRVELAPFGVKVVVVEPGGSPTAIWETSRQRGLANLARRAEGAGAYTSLVAAVEKFYARSAAHGFPPRRFAGLVEKILDSPRPRARYALPRRVAWLIRLRSLVPDLPWDWGVRGVLKW